MKPLRINKSPIAKERAREMRNNPSVGEAWFWAAVRKDLLGFRFRRQHRVGDYFLDFYCPSAKLCVEIDGEQHAERVEADARRDAYLTERGVLTLRIPSLDLFEKERDLYSKWVDETRRICEQRVQR